MGKINVGRWLAGGIVAGIIVWLLEGAGAQGLVEMVIASLVGGWVYREE